MEIWNSAKKLTISFCATPAGSLPLWRGRYSGIVAAMVDETRHKIIDEIVEVTVYKMSL